MTTLATLKTDIADDLARSDLSDAIGKEITAAIEQYQSSPFWFNEKRDVTVDTVVDQANYTLSDDVWSFEGVFVTWNGKEYELAAVTLVEWQSMQGAASSGGWPTCYVRHSGELLLYPTPNAVESLTIGGVVGAAAPASDTEADNPWMNEARELIRARVNRMICQKKTKDYEQAMVWQASENEELDSLRNKTSKKRATGKIVPTNF